MLNSGICFFSHCLHSSDPKDKEVGFLASHCYFHALPPPHPIKMIVLWIFIPLDHITLLPFCCYYQQSFHYPFIEHCCIQPTLLALLWLLSSFLVTLIALLFEFLDLCTSDDLFFHLPWLLYNGLSLDLAIATFQV